MAIGIIGFTLLSTAISTLFKVGEGTLNAMKKFASELYFKLLTEDFFQLCGRIFVMYCLFTFITTIIISGFNVDILVYNIIAPNIFIPSNLISAIVFEPNTFKLESELNPLTTTLEYSLQIPTNAGTAISAFVYILNAFTAILIPFRFIGFWFIFIKFIMYCII